MNMKKSCLVCLSEIDWWNHQRRFVMWKTRGRRGRCTTRKSMILVDENSDRRVARVVRRIYLTEKLFAFGFVTTVLKPEVAIQVTRCVYAILLPYLDLLFLELKHRRESQTSSEPNLRVSKVLLEMRSKPSIDSLHLRLVELLVRLSRCSRDTFAEQIVVPVQSLVRARKQLANVAWFSSFADCYHCLPSPQTRSSRWNFAYLTRMIWLLHWWQCWRGAGGKCQYYFSWY